MSSPIDLTTLPVLKAWLGLGSTSDDLVLASLITSISAAILADTGRGNLQPAVYNETHDGGGESVILLRQWPVSQLLSAAIADMPLAIVTSPSAAAWNGPSAFVETADPAPPGRMQSVSLLGGCYPNGLRNVILSYRAGYEITAEAAVVPVTPPYALTPIQPYGAWQSDGAVSYANGTALVPSTVPVPPTGSYTVTAGVYTFAAGDAGRNVVLRYGYVPADLARACCDWAAERYAYRSRIGQSSKSLGGQETTAFIVKDIPDFVSRLLQPYRRVVTP